MLRLEKKKRTPLSPEAAQQQSQISHVTLSMSHDEQEIEESRGHFEGAQILFVHNS